ncbi:MAG: hypothetical protein HYR51_17710 [Candidatus Rokubacteria bacterium]|nr:hypothetical protein [Candidatus Rokubacteria bacterium]
MSTLLGIRRSPGMVARGRHHVKKGTHRKHFYAERYIGCDIGNPRYDAYARLFGATGYYVDQPDQVGDAVRAALTCGTPAIVEIPIDPDEFPTPATAARRTAG